MNSGLLKITLKLFLVLVMALAAASCGRRGGLEAPQSASVITADENGKVSEEPVREDKPFILDPLL